MKIVRISVFQASLPYVGGKYMWGPGQVIDIADTTIVTIETDAGVTGVGECCPCGRNYLAAYPEGIRAAMPILAAALLGQDPRALTRIERIMDVALKGHVYAKAAIDIACWDILGKSCELPCYMLLGGHHTEAAPMYRVVPQKSVAEAMKELQDYRETGYRHFQIKAGADPDGDIERIHAACDMLRPGETVLADANTGWRVDQAVRVVRAVRDRDVVIEQPCPTYEECLQVRARCDHPMKLDECVTDLSVAARIVNDKSAEIVCLKLSKQGGLTKARRMRDYLLEFGFPVVTEDTWGGEIATAAVAHFTASTPRELLFNTTDLHNYNTVSTGKPGPETRDGKLIASPAPGLGVEPEFDVLGEPVAMFA